MFVWHEQENAATAAQALADAVAAALVAAVVPAALAGFFSAGSRGAGPGRMSP